MDYAERFKHTERIYQEVCGRLTNPRNFFFTQAYADLRITNLKVSSQLDNFLKALVDVLLGSREGTDDYWTVQRHWAYPDNHIKNKEAAEQHALLEELLLNSTRLGLMVHLFLVKGPTREEWIEVIDLDSVRREWLARIIRVDRLMQRYNSDVRRMPGRIFDGYYCEYVEPRLREELSMSGFLTMKRQYDYFRRLFFAGILLGLETDLAIRLAGAANQISP